MSQAESSGSKYLVSYCWYSCKAREHAVHANPDSQNPTGLFRTGPRERRREEFWANHGNGARVCPYDSAQGSR